MLAKIVVSGGLLGWLALRSLERDGFDLLLDRMSSARPEWLALAIGLNFVAVAAGVARWRRLLRTANLELGAGWLGRTYLVARFVGAFTPSTTGLDGWRLLAVAKVIDSESSALERSGAVIVVEKLVGLLAMSTVCAALVPLGATEILGPRAIAGAALIFFGATVGLLIARRPWLLFAIAARGPKIIAPRIVAVASALETLGTSSRALAGAIGWGVVGHLALSAVFWASARAIGLEIDAASLFMVGNAIVLAVLLPVSIGGVGVREGVAVLLLGAVGVASTDAVLVGLLTYLTGQAPALVGGLFMMGTRAQDPTETSRDLIDSPA